MNFRGTAYTNKHIKKWQQQRTQDYHAINLRRMRPVTSNLTAMEAVPLNNKKKQMQNEDRFTQIERENRILLEKITGIMNKKSIHSSGSYSTNNNKMNKSLNSSFRKRQLQNIEVENAKLLKRLQEKKPTYETEKLHKDWSRQKGVIKNMSNFPFIIPDRRKVQRKTSYNLGKPSTKLNDNIQLCRMRVIDGINFLITLKLDKQKLQIVGDTKNRREIKVIEIGREQALDFIQTQCNGKIEEMFKKLHYDANEQVLYLIGDNDDDNDNPQGLNSEQQLQQEVNKALWVPIQNKKEQQHSKKQQLQNKNFNKPMQATDNQLQKPKIQLDDQNQQAEQGDERDFDLQEEKNNQQIVKEENHENHQ